MRTSARWLAGSLVLLAAAACGGPDDPRPPEPLATPVRVSGASPFSPGCNGQPQTGVRWGGTEVEPHLAVHPLDPDHLVATWQQDRWSDGGADGILAAVSIDGGLTWTSSPVPFSRCAGGGAPDGDHERASDPWVSFSREGALVYAAGLAFDRATPRSSIVVSRSADGGFTWSPAHAVETESDPDVALDKPTLTVDPTRPGHVYAVWDRLSGLATADPADDRGPARLARSTDGGATWEAARDIHDPGPDAQTISNQILVLPDGSLVDVFVRILQASAPSPLFHVVAIRSGDAGTSWAPPAVIAALQPVGATDPGTGARVRTGEVVPSAASDGNGRIWVAWQDGRFSGFERDGVALAFSDDGGIGWSAPARANRDPSVQAFRPAVAGGPGGEVAVTYYDFRPWNPADPSRAWTAFWRATSADGGATWEEVPLGGPFDLRTAPEAGGLFLGDYTGLVARRGGFHALFSMGRPPSGGDAADAWAAGP